MSDFVHLHVHSEYSLLDGLSKIPKLVSRAKVMGMKHLALTDHGALYGAIKFYKECREADINPIIGCEMYIAKRKLTNKEAGIDNENYHLTVLARDFQGYRNLMKLVTIAHLEGFYYRPRVDHETLAKYAKGLLALSGCPASEISKSLVAGDLKKAKDQIETYRQIFGQDNFFLEIQKHEFAKFTAAAQTGSEVHSELVKMAREEEKILEGSRELSQTSKIPLVATGDIHYVTPEDATAQDVIVCVQTGKVLSDVKRLRMIDSPTYFLKSASQMEELFRDFKDAVTQTLKIAQNINIQIPFGQVAFPAFPTPKGTTADEYLKKLCHERIGSRVEKVTEEIKERLEYELSVISKKGYSAYFLVVADFVNWARQNGIISTTRGSASGSLASFALGITTVNPLYFKLPFERFLNLYRPTLPDIDVDFADNRRDEVLEYVRDKFGRDKVAQIGTFGTMMARAAVRDVARVLGWPYTKADRIAKMVPFGAQGFHMSLETAKTQNRELGNLYQTDAQVQELLDLAQKVEGSVRHVSVHAAGVVIAPGPLTDFVPLQKETKGEKIITQYDMYDVEEAGLVKMDFLGIRNLSILGQAVGIVESTLGEKVDLVKIPFDDKKAFELLAKGETMGLFQLGGTGMTRYLKELKPTTIFDIQAMISLFRPGPMNSIPEFIARKHNPRKIKYFDPRMEEYLKESYGVIVYQDDVLLTAINIAGYNWEEADKFRKAMGKKIPAEMAKQKEKFTNGCVKNGMAPQKAEELFKLLEPFAAYGFNKAHAASYAVIAYQTAYMKANFPVEFMTAVMTAESDDPDKIAAAVSECGKMKIAVLPPDINHSQTGFTIEKNKKSGQTGIRFGLSAIKNVGTAAIDEIAQKRKEGQFKSLDDFVKRVNLRTVNRKTLESLIKAGAMDAFGKRNAMLAVLDEIKHAGTSLSSRVAKGQGTLFEETEVKSLSVETFSATLDSVEEAPKEEILSWERELLGLYLTEHPLAKIASQLSLCVSMSIRDIEDLIVGSTSQKNIKLGGIIISIRHTVTRAKKEEMCFIRLQDTTGTIEAIIFPKVYSASRNLLFTDRIVVIEGKLELGETTPVLIAEKVSELQGALEEAQKPKTIVEIFLPHQADRITLSQIYQVLKSTPGEDETVLVISQKDGEQKKLPVPFTIERTSSLEGKLHLLGCRIVASGI